MVGYAGILPIIFQYDLAHFQQMTLPVGSILIPLLFISDRTHLMNYSVDKKL